MGDGASILARDLLFLSPEEIDKTCPDYFDIEYDDGVIVNVTKEQAAFDNFYWEFHRRWDIPISHRHSIKSIIGNDAIHSGAIDSLIQRIAKDLRVTLNLNTPEDQEHVSQTIYQVVNEVNNRIDHIAIRGIFTVDIMDIISIALDPEVLRLKEETSPEPSSILEFYQRANTYIFENNKFKNNALLKYLKMKILRSNQINQCLLSRGYPMEVTGHIFKNPIMSNYVLGINNLSDFVADSRAAPKHLLSAEEPLQKSEYFARRLQLVSMSIHELDYTDCGSTKYVNFYVRPPQISSTGRKVFDGDLNNLEGIQYKDPDTGEMKYIEGNETHLNGRIIKLRQPIYCQAPDKHKVCVGCFGKLYLNVSRHANLGHYCAATYSQKVTQNILSTKHIIGTAIGAEIIISELVQRYFNFNHQNLTFFLKKSYDPSKLKVVFGRHENMSVMDLEIVENIESINPKVMTNIRYFEIKEEISPGHVVTIPMSAEYQGKSPYFSTEMLKHIIKNGYETDEHGNFSISLTGWDYRNPFFQMPDVEFSYEDLSKQFEVLIESNKKQLKERCLPTAPEKLLLDLYTLATSKISINLSILSVIVYGYMTPSRDNLDLSRGYKDPGLHIAASIIKGRSLGPAYVYQHQLSIVTHPRSFSGENNVSSPLDVYLMPKEVIANLTRKRSIIYD